MSEHDKTVCCGGPKLIFACSGAADVGLHLLGIIPMPFAGPGQVNMKRKGLLAAPILGLYMLYTA